MGSDSIFRTRILLISCKTIAFETRVKFGLKILTTDFETVLSPPVKVLCNVVSVFVALWSSAYNHYKCLFVRVDA